MPVILLRCPECGRLVEKRKPGNGWQIVPQHMRFGAGTLCKGSWMRATKPGKRAEVTR